MERISVRRFFGRRHCSRRISLRRRRNAKRLDRARIRVNEDSFNIQIKDARGQFHSFTKSELKELKRLQNETPMPSYESSLSAAELDDLVAYLASLKGNYEVVHLSGLCECFRASALRSHCPRGQRARQLADLFGKLFRSSFFSARANHAANVAGLRVKWAYQFESARTETSPIVVDGVMYITASELGAALALAPDANSGSGAAASQGLSVDRFRSVNRDLRFSTASYLSLRSIVIWSRLISKRAPSAGPTRVEDYKPGYRPDPRASGDQRKSVDWNQRRRAGIRGFVDAYDAPPENVPGDFGPVPAPGEPAVETWPRDGKFKDSWRPVEAPRGSRFYDPELESGLLGRRNPGPDGMPTRASATICYTCSLVRSMAIPAR